MKHIPAFMRSLPTAPLVPPPCRPASCSAGGSSHPGRPHHRGHRGRGGVHEHQPHGKLVLPVLAIVLSVALSRLHCLLDTAVSVIAPSSFSFTAAASQELAGAGEPVASWQPGRARLPAAHGCAARTLLPELLAPLAPATFCCHQFFCYRHSLTLATHQQPPHCSCA